MTPDDARDLIRSAQAQLLTADQVEELLVYLDAMHREPLPSEYALVHAVAREVAAAKGRNAETRARLVDLLEAHVVPRVGYVLVALAVVITAWSASLVAHMVTGVPVSDVFVGLIDLLLKYAGVDA